VTSAVISAALFFIAGFVYLNGIEDEQWMLGAAGGVCQWLSALV
jgi:hypothetical protein